MLWCDVAGCPGSGKSALCYPIWGDKSITWDGKPPPAHWGEFLTEVTSLIDHVSEHRHPVRGSPTVHLVTGMNNRSAKKMATVYRRREGGVFVQTGWCQRILGFGWRLQDMGRDVRLIRRALELMPISASVAFLGASIECLKERNRARRLNPATAHEDRSFMIEPMKPAIELAKEVLRDRGVPIAEIDVEHQPEDAARRQLLTFAYTTACHAPQAGYSPEAPLVFVPPWWQRP